MFVSLLDASVLIEHVIKGGNDPIIGFDDADRTLAEIRKEMNREIQLSKNLVESALYSAYLCNEFGKFSHPDGLSFQAFVAKLTPPGYRFNPEFNMFERKSI